MEAKYKLGDKVIVSGTATGHGNLDAVVIEVTFDNLSNAFFYNTRTD